MRGSSSNPPRLVLLGAPGAGKGTQSQLLCARLAIPHISTGDLLREARQARTRLGIIASAYLDKGELVPDDIVTQVVEHRLIASGPETGFALDGFPRTIGQADRLEEILRGLGAVLNGVIFYDCPESELIRRLSGRRVCDGCNRIYHFSADDPRASQPCQTCGGKLFRRDDYSPEAIRTRFKLYYELTQPLVDYYTQRGVLFRMDATADVEEIYLETLRSAGLAT